MLCGTSPPSTAGPVEWRRATSTVATHALSGHGLRRIAPAPNGRTSGHASPPALRPMGDQPP